MPKLTYEELGDTKRGYEIGYKGCNLYVWSACVDCGKERWARRSISPKRCKSCWGKKRVLHLCSRGSKHPCWRGGRYKDSHGYIGRWVAPDDFFYPMVTQQNYVLEHRLIMAHHLGRPLLPYELVHHLNGIKDDNRIENLQLVSGDRHKQITLLERRIKKLEYRIIQLEAENIALQNRVGAWHEN